MLHHGSTALHALRILWITSFKVQDALEQFSVFSYGILDISKPDNKICQRTAGKLFSSRNICWTEPVDIFSLHVKNLVKHKHGNF